MFGTRTTLLTTSAATVSLALAACATVAPSGTGRPTDVELQARVKAALAADSSLIGRQIDVSVKDGVAHLRGFVESTHDLILAEGDAKSVPGVVSVDAQEVQIARGGSPP